MLSKKISIICIYNNVEILNSCLLKSLEKQTLDYELILINNTKNIFSSIADGLNYAKQKANGEYIIFVHQDVFLTSNDWLLLSYNYLRRIKNLGVAGVAGVVGNHNNCFRNEIFNNKKKWGVKIRNFEKVESVDECLFILSRKISKKFRFDSQVCSTWHLYAVEMCLKVQQAGYQNYVLPLFIKHENTAFKKFVNDTNSFWKSHQSFPNSYYQTLAKLRKKYKKFFPVIYTTCGSFNTRYPVFIYKYFDIFKNIFIRNER